MAQPAIERLQPIQMVSIRTIYDKPRLLRRIAGASALILLASAVPLLLFILLFPERDPFDKFEVIAVEEDPVSGRHAATYRYHHANSSADLFAIWLLPKPPPIGSTQPPAGRAQPVLVWTNRADVIARRWAKGRLIVIVANGTDRRQGKLDDCYFAGEYDLKRPVCFDPGMAQLVDEGT